MLQKGLHSGALALLHEAIGSLGFAELSARLEDHGAVELHFGFPVLSEFPVVVSPAGKTAGARFLDQRQIAPQVGFRLRHIAHLHQHVRDLTVAC